MTLHALLGHAVSRFEDHIAVEDTGGATVSYGELGRLSDRVRDHLHTAGVRGGDRVGVHLSKSIDAVAAIFGILKVGAAYVPVDVDAPTERAAFILDDCSVAAVFTDARLAPSLRAELNRLGARPILFELEPMAAGPGIELLAGRSVEVQQGQTPEALPLQMPLPGRAPASESSGTGPDALAYILYTSGSTGRPKGVMLTHRCALSFIEWCAREFRPTPTDRFSSHAPFHFDLSILDLYLPLSHGATLVLVEEDLGKDPRALAPFIAEKRLTVWYSVPSVLSLLAQYGKLERYDYGKLRLVLFAGEVFPVPRLRALTELWPKPVYYNLYGPTETNVCTYHRLPAVISPDRLEPFPIGRTCEHLNTRVIDETGKDVLAGAIGELVVTGPAVMAGYWNLPEQDAAAFIVDERGTPWYRTGDLVQEDAQEGYIFHGRRDRMVKRRGYRIELGEIEAGLATHPAVREVAVVAQRDAEANVRIRAYLSMTGEERLSLVQLKQFSVERLPRYMVPDTFDIVASLPRTSTDKIDYRTLEGGL